MEVCSPLSYYDDAGYDQEERRTSVPLHVILTQPITQPMDIDRKARGLGKKLFLPLTFKLDLE